MNKLQKYLIKKFPKVHYSHQHHNHVLLASMEQLRPLLTSLKEKHGFVMLLDICGLDNLQKDHSKRFECVYHLLNMGEHQRLRLRIPIDGKEPLPSITDIWKSADWFEREVWDMFGIAFKGKEKERLLTHKDFVGHPLQKDYNHQDIQKLSSPQEISFKHHGAFPRHYVDIEPFNPATQGILKIALELEGETVTQTHLEIGYLHRCFEKICERLSFNQIIPYTDRLNYCSAAMNNIGWCKSVETLMGIEIPDRAKVIRMIVAELSRVADHILCIETTATGIGAISHHSLGLRLREQIYQLFEKLCGARITVSLTRIGGMAQDISYPWARKCRDSVNDILKKIVPFERYLTRNNTWLARTKVCPVSAENAIEWGHTGPCLRACGVNYDIRKASPYYFYDDIDFEIPLGINGDCYDRYLVRIEEIKQSLKMVLQLLDNLPSGSIMSRDDRVALPDKQSVHTDRSSFIKHVDRIQRGIAPPSGEIYSCTEAANGELGFYIVSDGSPRPYRVKVRPPCFPILQSLPQTIHGWLLPDAIMSLSSMNIVPGELER